MCPSQPDATTPLIDDLEDGDDSVPQEDGRIGFWYTFNDSSDGTQTPPPGQDNFLPIGPGEGANGTDFAAHTEGFGFTGVPGDLTSRPFALLMMPIAQVAGNYCWYDASMYTGVSFWAKGSQPVRFLIATAATTSTAQFGYCGVWCGNHFFVTVPLTTEWAEYSFTWDEFAKDTWGDPYGDLIPSELLEFQWGVYGPDATDGFDFTVDEIAFTTG